MAIRDLLWACPLCATTGDLHASRRADRCHACGAEFRRDVGAMIRASTHSAADTTMSPAGWLARLPPRDPANVPAELAPERAVLRVAVRKQPVRRGRELIGWLDRFGPRRFGTLRLSPEQLHFNASHASIEWRLDQLTAIQLSSSKLLIAARRMPVAAISFSSASVRLWEETIREAVRHTWRACDRGEITEFHPRITAR